MTKILVVDDHALVRRGIAHVLTDGIPGVTIREAASPAEAVEALHAEAWALVVLDISLPGRSGLELLREIKTQHPCTPVLILSAYPESLYSTRTLRAGASGYLTKGGRPSLLVQAVRQILSGDKFITPSAELQFDKSKPAHELLSDREFDVMLKIASGCSVTEIAEVMHLSAKTVDTYRARLLTKMALKNNAALTHYALRNRLIE